MRSAFIAHILLLLFAVASIARSQKLDEFQRLYEGNIYMCLTVCENDSCQSTGDSSYYYIDNFSTCSYKGKIYHTCTLENLMHDPADDDTMPLKRNSCYSEIWFDTTADNLPVNKILFLSERTCECPWKWCKPNTDL